MANFLLRDPDIVFVHIPKCGGTSIRAAFSDNFVSRSHGIFPQAWRHLPSFAVIRNPIDRFISAVNMFRSGSREMPRRSDYYSQPRLPDLTATRALDILCDPSIPFDRSIRTDEANLKHHLWPQTDPYNCLSYAKSILRFEDLENDFAELCAQIGANVELPMLRVTRGGDGTLTSMDLSSEELRRIRSFFSRDFVELGYDDETNTVSTARQPPTAQLRDLWRPYFDTVVASKLSLSETLPDSSIDLAVFAQQMVRSTPGPTWPGRKKNPLEHFRCLEPEFAGRSRLAHLMACVIVVLRRDRSNERASALFGRIVAEHGTVVAESLNLRWLTSVCDTFIDISNSNTDKALALAGTLFANTVKVAETERKLFYPERPWPPKARLSRGGPLFDGVISYWVGKGDMISNLLDRMDGVLDMDSDAAPFVREIVNRTIDNDTFLTRIYSLQGIHPPEMASKDKIAALRAAMKDL